MTISDYIGAIGVGLLLIAYLLSIFKILHLQHPFYLLLNVIGAALACLASVLLLYWPFIILEGVWAFVSLIALIRIFIKKTNINSEL